MLHLLNVAGGYWLFETVRQQNDEQLARRFDGDRYAGSQTITIKLPLSHYSGPDNANYERVDGEVEYKGEVYRLVKQKFYRDTAYIVCYKDEKTIALNHAVEDYVKSFADNPGEKKSDTKAGMSFIKDYVHQGKSFLLTPAIAQDVAAGVRYLDHYRDPFHTSPDRPPIFAA